MSTGSIWRPKIWDRIKLQEVLRTIDPISYYVSNSRIQPMYRYTMIYMYLPTRNLHISTSLVISRRVEFKCHKMWMRQSIFFTNVQGIAYPSGGKDFSDRLDEKQLGSKLVTCKYWLFSMLCTGSFKHSKHLSLFK